MPKEDCDRISTVQYACVVRTTSRHHGWCNAFIPSPAATASAERHGSDESRQRQRLVDPGVVLGHGPWRWANHHARGAMEGAMWHVIVRRIQSDMGWNDEVRTYTSSRTVLVCQRSIHPRSVKFTTHYSIIRHLGNFSEREHTKINTFVNLKCEYN